MSLFQILAICGLASPILYTVMWILGGIVRSDYNHVRARARAKHLETANLPIFSFLLDKQSKTS